MINSKGEDKDDFVLLKTSSGRTTPCETIVEIKDSGVDEIVVEKLLEEEFENLLEEYCESFFKDDIEIPEETKRIIGNMLGLKSIDKNEEKLKNIKTELGISKIDSKELFDYAKKKINHTERNKLKYVVDKNDISGSFKSVLAKITTSNQDGCPYPGRIKICLNAIDFGVQIPSFVKSITDTRGIDSPERKDINDTIRELDTITIMCDRIGSFGEDGNITSILKSSLIEENKDDTKRFFYLGLERGKELAKVEGAENNESYGKEIKKDEAISKFGQNHLNIMEANILFFNAFKGIKLIDDSDISEFNENVFRDNIEMFWENLYEQISQMYRDYSSELSENIIRLNSLKSNQITDRVLNIFDKIKSNVENEKENLNLNYKILENLAADLTARHYSKLKAMVKRNGEYYNSNIYDNIFKLGGDEFLQEISSSKDRLIGQIEEMFLDDDDTEITCKIAIMEHINAVFNKIFNDNQEYYYTHLKENIYNDIAWKEQTQYSGDRYKKRVIQKTIDVIQDCNFIRSRMYENFFRGINDFLTL